MRAALIYPLGLFVSSLFACAASAQDITPPKVYSLTAGGVNLSDGSFTFTVTDLVIGDLKLERIHQGGRRDPNDPFFGPRMSHNHDIYVTPNQKTTCAEVGCTTFRKPVVHLGTSASGTYYEDLPPYVSITASNDEALSGVLAYNANGAYVYTDGDGAVFTFSTTVSAPGAANSRRVSDIVFPDGRRRDYLYNGSGQLKAVVDSGGYALVFDYGSNGKVATACGYNLANSYVSVNSSCAGAELKTLYGYSADSVPKLTSVTDVRGNVTSYGYDRNEISCVTPPAYSGCKVANVYGLPSSPWQVTQQTLGGSSVWRFTYSGDYSGIRDPEAYPALEPQTQVSVEDPAGKFGTYSFVQTSPFTATDANSRTTSYRFRGGRDYQAVGVSENHSSSLAEATLPEGNKYLAEHYGPRRSITRETQRAKPGSGLADISTQSGYVADCTTSPNTPQNCAKPIWTRDAKGNQTDYTYTSNGLLLTAMQPAPSAGAPRPLKVNTYVQKYAWVRNSGGGLTQAASAIWVPQTETVCQTATGSNTPVCDSAAVQTVTTYEYGPDGTANNLRVRGTVVSSGGTSLRTCYGYDWRGNKISQTSPRAGLSVCQ